MPLPRPRSRAAAVVAAGAGLITLTAAAVVLRPPAMAQSKSGTRVRPPLIPGVPQYTPPAEPTRAPHPDRHATVHHVVNGIGAMIAALALLCLVAAVVYVAYLLVQWWRDRTRRERAVIAPPDPAAALQAAMDDGFARLRLDAPSNAIIGCWVAIEEGAERSGVPKRSSDTSAEFALRLLDSLDVDSEALQQLSGLYRRARFSTQPMTEADREAALAYLERIRSTLPARGVPAGSGAR